jgi:peptide methionine sulfoxide reductase msrA/msrB
MNQTAIFAGGCFWCTEHDLKELPGVVSALAGYSGGTTSKPSYYNHSDHRESVQITYNPEIISYKKLCQFFLDHIDPTDSGGQFYDRGIAYKTAIFYENEGQKDIAESLLRELDESGLYAPLRVMVDVLPKSPFYSAEEYHQDYAEKNPAHYQSYAKGSGRVQFVANTCAVRDQKHIQWKD